MRWFGTADDIMNRAKIAAPDIDAALTRARQIVPQYKREISLYQAAALYVLAKRYGTLGSHILEIGTAHGYSAAVMALAAPEAQIITLNPKDGEMETAAENLATLNNVTVVKARSEDYLDTARGTTWDMIFDDGDHQHVAANLPYFDLLREGGLMLWHDYSDAQSWRPCPPVYEVVNQVCAARGQDAPDVTIIDDGGVGMAGLYKHKHPEWDSWGIPVDFAPWRVQYEPKPKRWVRDDD